jgi:hypothetical protein
MFYNVYEFCIVKILVGRSTKRIKNKNDVEVF